MNSGINCVAPLRNLLGSMESPITHHPPRELFSGTSSSHYDDLQIYRRVSYKTSSVSFSLSSQPRTPPF